jgi:Na+-transporting methylmalonyl-CoA/oxaloacetate decarboxylase gamma subunit
MHALLALLYDAEQLAIALTLLFLTISGIGRFVRHEIDQHWRQPKKSTPKRKASRQSTDC